MSNQSNHIARLLRRYLSGHLTAPEEAELERHARRDADLAAALRAADAHPEADHSAAVSRMLSRVQEQNSTRRQAKIRPLYRWLSAAAALLVLITAVFLLRPLAEPETMAVEMQEPVEKQETRPAGGLQETRREPETEAPAPTATPNDPGREESRKERGFAIEGEMEEAIVEEEAVMDDVQVREPPPPAATIQSSPPPDTQTSTLKHQTSDLKYPPPLTGRITSPSGEPLANALIRRPGQALGERTDSNGFFRVPRDATLTRLEISHPDYAEELVEVNADEDLEITMEPVREDDFDWLETVARSRIILDDRPALAEVDGGYAALRERINRSRPEEVERGKVRVSFTVAVDGSVEDFRFRGQPSEATERYVRRMLVDSSSWNVVGKREPVRVYLKLRLK